MNIKRIINIFLYFMKKKIIMPLILQVSKLFFDKQKIVWHEIRNEGVYTDENQKELKNGRSNR